MFEQARIVAAHREMQCLRRLHKDGIGTSVRQKPGGALFVCVWAASGFRSIILTTMSLLIYGEGCGGGALLHAVNKKTGEEIAEVEIPAPTNRAPMTYMHEGRQYIILSVAGRGHAAEHVVLALPEE